MKKNILALFLFGLISSGAYAQDDMYFTPKKTEKVVKEVAPVASYHENHMDVDEYNRRGFWGNEGYVQASDTTASDVIDFSPSDSLQTTAYAGAEGEYDESYNPEDDYVYSRRMSRFDDFLLVRSLVLWVVWTLLVWQSILVCLFRLVWSLV